MISMYGLKNCDTCRAAWLVAEGLDYGTCSERWGGSLDMRAWVATLG